MPGRSIARIAQLTRRDSSTTLIGQWSPIVITRSIGNKYGSATSARYRPGPNNTLDACDANGLDALEAARDHFRCEELSFHKFLHKAENSLTVIRASRIKALR